MSSWRYVSCPESWSSMFVKQPLAQNTRASAVTSSGTRLSMTSHSEAPSRVKRTPASARRYCPVIVQVQRRWIRFIIFCRYISRAPLSPRDGYSPGAAGV